ncbi:hypothetical protein KJK34_11310 [Flavobacterium sp. D11R37]|uniref:hypothetical protein n=1 Tax=Flavobacterium coralii TaxID=2838017 RepID=UPI001CA73B34|nr:hypothetical protein [Flavobacterium coralii]MBY8963342.1 hypothetical protein [Flavobacterium coralii]
MNDMIIGSFYLQLTINGNLTGEFVNQHSQRAATESADRRSGAIDRFVGTYNSTWFDGQAQNMTLTINEKRDNAGDILLNIFRLRWSDGNNRTVFVGKGFLANNMLLGVYADNVLDNHIGNLLTREN